MTNIGQSLKYVAVNLHKMQMTFQQKESDNSKWIDPRAASATRALLRLIPCHQSCLRPRTDAQTSGTTGSLELTGGEYKTRERIHPGVLTRDY